MILKYSSVILFKNINKLKGSTCQRSVYIVASHKSQRLTFDITCSFLLLFVCFLVLHPYLHVNFCTCFFSSLTLVIHKQLMLPMIFDTSHSNKCASQLHPASTTTTHNHRFYTSLLHENSCIINRHFKH